MSELLTVRNARVQYGQTVAVDDVSLSVNEGEIVAILGRNGAGKTSLALAISRIVPLIRGELTFGGDTLTRRSPQYVARAGLLQVPEGRGVLRDLTVKENLVLGGIASSRPRKGSGADWREVLDLFPILESRLDQKAGSLSGGEQQMLVIGRALLGRPRLLILDEPSLGLAPQIVKQIFQIFGRYAATGMAILLIEQNVALSLAVADRAYILSNGSVAISGGAEALRGDARLQSAYLGGEVDVRNVH